MSKAYFFQSDKYIRYDTRGDTSDPGYPQSITQNWRGLPASGIDAALNWGNGKAYFFVGTQYFRYDIQTDAVDPGYPCPIAGGWKGLPDSSIDACVRVGSSKVYFFKDNLYWRYDMKNDSVDDGYPIPISQGWKGLATDSVDAALNWGNGKLYFFRQEHYWRYDLKADAVEEGPIAVAGRWPGLFTSNLRAPIMLAQPSSAVASRNWGAQGLFSVGEGWGIAVKGSVYSFMNFDSGATYCYALLDMGFGAGAGFKLPKGVADVVKRLLSEKMIGNPTDYTPIVVNRPFSANDLAFASGAEAYAGVTIYSLNASVTLISAWPFFSGPPSPEVVNNDYFSGSEILSNGFSIGLDLKAGYNFKGVWIQI